ncbi:MAG: hypothetical protein FWH03_00880 [Firmicutes bacterium]|nr:hypothetical protein [Bacillota bacterium]
MKSTFAKIIAAVVLTAVLIFTFTACIDFDGLFQGKGETEQTDNSQTDNSSSDTQTDDNKSNDGNENDSGNNDDGTDNAENTEPRYAVGTYVHYNGNIYLKLLPQDKTPDSDETVWELIGELPSPVLAYGTALVVDGVFPTGTLAVHSSNVYIASKVITSGSPPSTAAGQNAGWRLVTDYEEE